MLLTTIETYISLTISINLLAIKMQGINHLFYVVSKNT